MDLLNPTTQEKNIDVGVAQPVAMKESEQGSKKELSVQGFHNKTSAFKQNREIIHAREEQTKLSGRIGNLIVPMIAIGILVLIVSFVFIPFSTEIIETRRQTKDLLAEIHKKQLKVSTLESIDVADLEQTLRMVTKVVKDEMDVSEMAREVESLALENNLQPESQSATNSFAVVGSAANEDNTDWEPDYADSISGPFSFSGSFGDICGFINDLRLRSSTILSLGEMSVSHRNEINEATGEETDRWYVSFDIKGYVARPSEEVGIDDPVRTDLDENIMNEIEQRAVGFVGGDEENAEDEDSSEGADDEDDGEDNGIQSN